MTHLQYLKLKEHFSVVTMEECQMADPSGITENSFPCLRFTAGSLNGILDEYDEMYIDDIVKLGTRNPWNFAQFLVAMNPLILERL